MVQLSALSMAAVSVAALAAVGGGVSYAAKDAQPGDLLYGVHTSVYGDASLNAEEEMDDMQTLHDTFLQLDAEGEVDADVRTELIDDYESHISVAEEAIAELEANGRTEEAASLRAMLQAKASLFNSILMGSSSSSSSSSFSQASDSSNSSSSDDDDEDSSSSHNGLHMEADDSASAGIESNSNSNVHVDVNADASATVDLE